MTIQAQIGATFEALLIDAPPDMLGELGFRVDDPSSATTVIAHRTTGITEPSPGTYYTTEVAPLVPYLYIVVWDHSGTEAAEDLEVRVAPVIGPRYATVTDLRNYSPPVEGYSDDDLNDILRQAERWIDSYIPPAPMDEVSGLKFNPLNMPVERAIHLNYATCAQAEYMLQMGPGFFMSGSTRISGGDYQEAGAPKVADKAKRHLLDGGFIRLTGRIATSRDRWQSEWQI